MSYDINLIDPVTRETIEFDEPHHMKGGTYQMGGTQKAWINITWNYSQFHAYPLTPTPTSASFPI